MFPYKGVVFDLDGVIIDSIAVMRKAFAHAYGSVVGAGDPPFDRFCEHLGSELGELLRTLGLPAEMKPLYIAEAERLVDEVRVFEGIPELLHGLAERGITLGVATGKHGYRARRVLAKLDLASWFAVVVGGDEVRRGKPAPDSVERALDAMKLQPDEVILVGDAPFDLMSGRAAGVDVAAALWGNGDRDRMLEQLPDVVLEAPLELLRLPGGARGEALHG